MPDWYSNNSDTSLTSNHLPTSPLHDRIVVAPQKVPRDPSVNSVAPTILKFLVHVPSHPLLPFQRDHRKDHLPFRRDHQKDHLPIRRDHQRELPVVPEAQAISHPSGAQMDTEICNGEVMDIPMSSNPAVVAAALSPLAQKAPASLARNPLAPKAPALPVPSPLAPKVPTLPVPSPLAPKALASLARREVTSVIASLTARRVLTLTTASHLAQNHQVLL